MKCIISVVSCGIHSGRRFIQQQQAWLAGQGACNFQSALGTIRQVTRQLVSQADQTDKIQQFPGILDRLFSSFTTRGV